MAHPKEFAEGLSIGIIMDGNGRWAKNRGLPRTAGHKRGAEVFSDIADFLREAKAKAHAHAAVYLACGRLWIDQDTGIVNIYDILYGHKPQRHIYLNVHKAAAGSKGIVSALVGRLSGDMDRAVQGIEGGIRHHCHVKEHRIAAGNHNLTIRNIQHIPCDLILLCESQYMAYLPCCLLYHIGINRL